MRVKLLQEVLEKVRVESETVARTRESKALTHKSEREASQPNACMMLIEGGVDSVFDQT